MVHTLRKPKLRGIERARKASKGRVSRGRPLRVRLLGKK